MKRAFALLMPALIATAASAAPIGNAVTVKPDASLETLAGTVALAVGRGVEANERVVTGPAGATRLRFLDSSVLDVGAGAAVTLDDFVYRGRKAEKAALTMTKGAFRWVSGSSPKEAYDIKTPLATIGIRGTDFRVDTDEARSTIRLASGAINACSRVSQSCALLTRPGQGVHVYADGRIETFEESRQAAPPPTRRAAAPPPPPPPPQRIRRQAERDAAPPPRRAAAEYAPPRRRYVETEYAPPPRRVSTRAVPVYVDDEPDYVRRPARQYPPTEDTGQVTRPLVGAAIGAILGAAVGIGVRGFRPGRTPGRAPVVTRTPTRTPTYPPVERTPVMDVR